MSHRRFAELVSLYCDSRLTGPQDALLTHHLAQCAQCKSRLTAYRETGRLLRHMPRPAPTPAAEGALFQALREGRGPRQTAGRAGHQWMVALVSVASLALVLLFGLALVQSPALPQETPAPGPFVRAPNLLPPTPVPITGRPQLYAVNNTDIGSITVVDAETYTVVKTVELAFRPWTLALSRPLKRLFVGGQSTSIAVVDTEANELVDSLPIGSPVGRLLVHPNGKVLYASHPSDGSISLVDLARRKASTVRVGGQPTALTATPDGRWLFAASSDGQVFQIEPSALRKHKAFTLRPGGLPAEERLTYDRPALAVAPDGRLVYAALLAYGEVWTINPDTGETQRFRVPAKGWPRNAAVSPDGRRLYLTYTSYDRLPVRSGFMTDEPPSGGLLVLDAATLQEISHNDTTPFFGLALRQDGQVLYLTNLFHQTLYALESQSQQLLGAVDVGERPADIAFKP